jgi:putative flavoprotein involved in K+ transport
MARAPKLEATFDCIVLGAGPAGIGTALALRAAGVDNLALVDGGLIGESFRRWPQGMRLITPSFTANQFGHLDLNSVHPSTSPAFTLGTEHPAGPDYADYLKALTQWGKLPVLERVRVKGVEHGKAGFTLTTEKGSLLRCKNLVWAGGEFQNPNRPVFPGAEHCMHNSSLRDWEDLKGERFVVIGGYESGIDAAFHLIRNGKTVAVLDPAAPWASRSSDPSVTLSPYTQDRLKVALASKRLTLIKGKVDEVQMLKKHYVVKGGKKSLTSDHAPILATGFRTSLEQIHSLFEWNNGIAKVSQLDDQSTKTPGLYLAGPSLRHHLKDKLIIFCFIYKFRGRFPLVARSIAKRLGAKKARIESMVTYYKKQGMFLEDLSCCGDECEC